MLKGKHIVIGITGGIAAYKAAVLVRLLKKQESEVQVIMTESAKEFISPLTLSTLSENPVIWEFFSANNGEWHSHVKLGLWADLMIIAPATANTIGKMANGIADNMLLTSYLSTRAKVFVAPAMDVDMWQHNTTKRNLKTLINDGVNIIYPEDGELASGLVGTGRMAEPENILKEILKYFQNENNELRGKKFLVTAGPTYEKIDPVRFIGNYSSGKMGFAIAEAIAEKGGEVFLISGPSGLKVENQLIKRIDIETADEMLSECLKYYENVEGAVFAAAVADYRPENSDNKKIKRESKEEISLKLVSNPDIAKILGQKKQSRINVGFALETHDEVSNALKKLKSKNLDWIILNSLNDKGAGFNKDTNKVTMISTKGDNISIETKLKTELAKDIVRIIFENEA